MRHDTAWIDESRSGGLAGASSFLAGLAGALDASIVAGAFWYIAGGRSMFEGRILAMDLLHVSLVMLLMASAFKISRSWRGVRLRSEFTTVVAYAGASFSLISASYYAMGLTPVDQASQWLYLFVRSYAIAFAGMVLARLAIRLGLRYYRARGNDVRHAALIGSRVDALRISDVFDKHPWMGIRVLGIFNDNDCVRQTHGGDAGAPAGHVGSGQIEDLHRLARQGLVNRIYIALPAHESERINAIIERFQDTTASVFYCPPALQVEAVTARWDRLYGMPVLAVVDTPFDGLMGGLKRLEDLVLLALVLPFALPLMAVIAVAVRLTSEGPALFIQNRYGLDGKPFAIRKFRTMYCVESDSEFRQATKDDPRVTRLGKFLRKTSLDELPQLLNVLEGSMSVVGPRPHPVRLDEQYRDQVRRYMLRNKIKPGITGLAQVRGWRGETQTIDRMEERVKTDIEYIGRWSLWLDCKILLRTLIIPIRSQGAY